MEIFGELVAARFARKYPAARKPLQRFLRICRQAAWPHLPALKETFASADYAPETGTVIFNLGGNKYRIVALIDFERQEILMVQIMTHETYGRKQL
jgi:mRNA interferase HigB